MAAVKGKTKDLQVKRTDNGLHYYIDFEEGGQLPESLKGLYTKPYLAEQAIASYVNTRRPRSGSTES